MTQFSERHIRLIKKDQELEKLFEQAANRRKTLLQQKNETEGHSKICKKEKFILKPLRSTDNLVQTDTNDNLIDVRTHNMGRNLQRNTSYYSHQNLPETNLDSEDISLHKLNSCTNNNNNCGQADSVMSSENLNKSGHHNPSFVTYSSSSDEVDTSNYCQFIPTTSSSTNDTTSSSHYSKTDNSTGQMSSFDPSSSDPGTHSRLDTDESTRKQSSVVFYPSGSPLISHKYQGSPVVRIDNKLRAGESDYLINRPRPTIGKPPIVPRHQRLPYKPMTCLVPTETRLSHPILVDNSDHDKVISSPGSADNPPYIPTSIVRRTKKKLLEEHMRKRFSVGDYSTRSLIEWQNNLNCAAIEHLSMSGDLQKATNQNEESNQRKFSSQSDALFPTRGSIDIIATAHNFSSEVNILHCNSTDSFKDAQVSFSLKNYKNKDSKTQFGHSTTPFKRTNFLQRSMNDIAAALRNVTASEKTHGSKKFLFSNRTHFIGHGMFKKRDSTSSDLLYSVPPFARKHMPPDISGAARIIAQATYQNTNLPSSSPNLIAELDPTFHERYPTETGAAPGVPNSDSSSNNNNNRSHNRLSKRNRSYRLSFIENAHTVTTRKLTDTSVTTSPANTAVPRFVQPRRRVGSRNSAMIKRHDSPPKIDAHHSRSRSCRRRSCAQQ